MYGVHVFNDTVWLGISSLGFWLAVPTWLAAPVAIFDHVNLVQHFLFLIVGCVLLSPTLCERTFCLYFSPLTFFACFGFSLTCLMRQKLHLRPLHCFLLVSVRDSKRVLLNDCFCCDLYTAVCACIVFDVWGIWPSKMPFLSDHFVNRSGIISVPCFSLPY